MQATGTTAHIYIHYPTAAPTYNNSPPLVIVGSCAGVRARVRVGVCAGVCASACAGVRAGVCG